MDEYGFKRMKIDQVSLEDCQQEAGMAERARTEPSYLSHKHREGNGSNSSEIIPEARPYHLDLEQSLAPNVQILSLLQTILFQVTTPSTQPTRDFSPITARNSNKNLL